MQLYVLASGTKTITNSKLCAEASIFSQCNNAIKFVLKYNKRVRSSQH